MKKRLIIILPILLTLISCSTKAELNSDIAKNSNESSIGENYKVESSKYSKNKINISYPKIVNLANDTSESKINEVIQEGAIRIVKSYSLEKDSLEIEYRIMLKNNKLLSIQYSGSAFTEGAAYPLNIFYTSNIDLEKGVKVKLTDLLEIDEAFVEEFKQSKYKSYDANLNLIEEGVMEDIWSGYNNQDLLNYIKQSDEVDQINESGTFSYITQDSIGVSISIPHALGDHLEMEMSFADLNKNIKQENKLWDSLVGK
ncbi:DUF4163 domain-containing protein [Paenibacillus sp. LMG 31459]|uniref:DUF4163 domain-containing protein n=1 Tax=Paenibacillus phytohabitans TaxID=2654978 RepID=A0ABX1YFZ5_9BACL|nr:DUF4163 domain-containing protein [Paenibacillus phytohabitans]NOU79773.1 DUF4163 domain-containing protein [Paenibacillus phytohabitans]